MKPGITYGIGAWPRRRKIAWSSVRANAVRPLMDGIIQSFYRHSERGQSVRTDKSKSSVIFHGSTGHMREANVMLHFSGETAPPRPTVNSKVFGQALTSEEGG